MKNAEDLLTEAEKEAEFFDKFYSEADEKQKHHDYIVPEKFIRQVTNPSSPHLVEFEYAYSILGNLEGKRLLDYGAGDGWNTICFAKAKANVHAIDISEKGIELIKKKAQANGVEQYVTAEVQNCYKTHFQTNTFDIIYGGGVLHHLDIEAAGQEISRILHPRGVAVFFEPIRETKIMDSIKAIVLRLLNRKALEETESETPLTYERINQLRQYFNVVNFRQFNALSSASLLINSESVKRFLLWTDYLLMKFIPGFKKLGRAVVVELRQPTIN